jgi:hypothetical protein
MNTNRPPPSPSIASRLVWKGKDPAGELTSKTLTVEYPQLTMHAVCRDTEAFSRPCVYCQLDAPVRGLEQPQVDSNSSDAVVNSESEDDGDEQDNAMDEMRLAPEDDAVRK